MPDHAVQRLDCVRCVDDFADVCRVSEERRQVSPVRLPAPAYQRIPLVPGSGEPNEGTGQGSVGEIGSVARKNRRGAVRSGLQRIRPRGESGCTA